jgi:FHS family glucose/mannose:H+ symporter-like MFS transporter
MNSGPPRRRKFPITTNGTLLLHIDFLLAGIVMTFLGPMLPSLSARWSLNDTQSGSLIFAEFFSSLFGMLLSSLSVQRLGYRKTLMIGLLLMALGVALLAFGPWLWGIACICVFGVGYGITTPAGNLRTAEINPGRSAAALSVINAVWGLGAMSSPFLVDLALRAHEPRLFFFGTAASLAILLLALALTRFVPDMHAEEIDASERPQSIWQIRILPVICALFFVYVGTETCFGNWVAMYARRVAPADHSFAIRMPAFFWGALLCGRALAPLALRFRRETSVAKIGLFFALLGGIALVVARGTTLIAIGSLLAGVGLASIYPISVSLLASWFGKASRRVSGAVFGSGNVGGALMPLMVGTISTLARDLRFGFLVPLAGVVFMLAFYALEQTKITIFTTEGTELPGGTFTEEAPRLPD